MEVLDATSLAERLRWEAKEYWLHLESDSPLEKYPAKQHARRVQEKLGLEEGLIYLPGQAARNNEDSDMPAPFRQLRYFYYLSGCNEPGCHLAYDIRLDMLSLFIPRIDPKRVIWNGRGSTQTEALDKYDVDEVYYVDQLPGFVQDWASCRSNQRADLYILHQFEIPPGFPRLDPRVDSVSLQPAMNIARMVKDDHEIKLIRKANDISSQAHREVLANILKFKNEAQVEGLFMDVCISRQAKQQAYDPIAASGPNAGTLHYDANNENFENRQLMCLDAGCEYELYASDITRTFPLAASWPSKEAENIYKLVQRMQESCIKRLAPGVRYLDLHIRAHQIAIDGLLQLGILHNGTREEIFKAGTSKAFFPHGLGHHIGLEVHDVGQAELMSITRGKAVWDQAPSLYPENFHVPVYDSKTCHSPTDPQSSHLVEGMVVTVEPGIYFSVYALQHFYLPSPVHSKYINAEVVQHYLPVGGVRIEDDILITHKGYENLTAAPKGDAMLDIIRSGKSNAILTPRTTLNPLRGRRDDETSLLLRAPGISNELPELIQRPLARAATMPAEFKRQETVDFEPFDGPSLFSNFKQTMTIEEKIQRWRESREFNPVLESPPAVTRSPIPVCGEAIANVQHVYISNASSLGAVSRAQSEVGGQGKCKNCAILVQTLDRLRQNLIKSTQTSPTMEQKPFFEPTRISKPEKARLEHPAEILRAAKETDISAALIDKCEKPDMPRLYRLHGGPASPIHQNRARATHNKVLAPCLSEALHHNTNLHELALRPLHGQQSMGGLTSTQSGTQKEGEYPIIARRISCQAESSTPSSAPNTRRDTTDRRRLQSQRQLDRQQYHNREDAPSTCIICGTHCHCGRLYKETEGVIKGFGFAR
ncbi:uncharacterized protein K460DRAFT_397380 [Cucurbitaria berberidis CBS 394.84]|uniref:Xaa-Pro aminopeptidase n=1 Tax=Cucurbitaria berberidis CBS 394.84 TaxID=1168544 RepID=A0A9P4GEP7_9PLEO|nr:uncharacterized protein K460DRAFT_397380 [Cucurbitaria berberidis CBS 394.84]KAF1844247.1 hypothetical protein K460DRAFT_397380 [Cucurbitaria berberidis CBS 394.84]